MNGDELAERTAALRDLIELRLLPVQAARALAGFSGWDGSQDLVTLSRMDARRVLDRYASGNLSADDCALWAEALEAREDVDYENGHEDLLTSLLFEMANPEINEPLSLAFLERWQAALGAAPDAPAPD